MYRYTGWIRQCEKWPSNRAQLFKNVILATNIYYSATNIYYLYIYNSEKKSLHRHVVLLKPSYVSLEPFGLFFLSVGSIWNCYQGIILPLILDLYCCLLMWHTFCLMTRYSCRPQQSRFNTALDLIRFHRCVMMQNNL